MKFAVFIFLALILSGCWIPEGQDDGYGGQGEIALEYRKFEDDSIGSNSDTGFAIFTRVEANYEWGEVKNVFRGFARIDQKDPDRGLIAIEDAYLSLRMGVDNQIKVLAGYKIFNWTATEAFHPADVINSRNLDSDLENLEKKGELTFEVESAFFDGAVSAYLFPYHTSPDYPGSRSRLGLGVVIDRPIWVDGTDTLTNSRWSPQWALRLTQNLFDGDFSAHVISHMDRDRPIIGTTNFTAIPGFGVAPNAGASVTVPHFFRVLQVGGTYQKPFESLIVKLEAAHRIYESELEVLTFEGLIKPIDHTDVAVGLEYPLNWDGGMETYLIFEGQMTIGPTETERARINVFQRDALFAIRHTFNDVMGKEIFASVIMDLERDSEFLFNANYTQRLSDNWKVKFGVRAYQAPQKGVIPRGLEVFHGDNHVHFSLKRFF